MRITWILVLALMGVLLVSTPGCVIEARVAVCGDGILDPGEDCDDGNNRDGDGCPADCRVVGCTVHDLDCGNGYCVASGLVCDGVDDCGNAADEVDCGCDPIREFTCDNGHCTDIANTCDEVFNDCGDWSDELACGGCYSTEMSCSVAGLSGCVDFFLTCDGFADCDNGLDEAGC